MWQSEADSDSAFRGSRSAVNVKQRLFHARFAAGQGEADVGSFDPRVRGAGAVKEIGQLSPETIRGYLALGGAGQKTDLLGAKVRELIALAVAVSLRCDGCITVHTEAAIKHGATNANASARRPLLKARKHLLPLTLGRGDTEKLVSSPYRHCSREVTLSN